MQLTIGS